MDRHEQLATHLDGSKWVTYDHKDALFYVWHGLRVVDIVDWNGDAIAWIAVPRTDEPRVTLEAAQSAIIRHLLGKSSGGDA